MIAAQPLLDFLAYLPGQKEVALVISHDPKELGLFTATLESQGFLPSLSVGELLQVVRDGKKAYLLADGSVPGQPKELYDFIAQYPTGQVQVWNERDRAMEVVSPRYEGVPPIVVTTISSLALFERQGFDFRLYSGLAYQTPYNALT